MQENYENTTWDKLNMQNKNNKKTQNTEIIPDHHTPILNDSSSSSENSSRLVLKSNNLTWNFAKHDIFSEKPGVMHFL